MENKKLEIDTNDIRIKNKLLTVPYFSLSNKKVIYKKFNISSTYYARLIAKEDFKCQGQTIKKGKKGAYVYIKTKYNFLTPFNNKNITKSKYSVKIGKNSWIAGGIKGTDKAESFIDKKVIVGDNTITGNNFIIGKHSVIGDNCKIGYCCTIGKNSVVGNNTTINDIATIGNKTYIGDNSHLGTKNIKGENLHISSNVMVGILPDHYLKLFKKLNINPHTMCYEKRKKIDKIKDFINDFRYNLKYTRIGENVILDSGAIVFKGGVVGNNAKVGKFAVVKPKQQIDNDSIYLEKS